MNNYTIVIKNEEIKTNVTKKNTDAAVIRYIKMYFTKTFNKKIEDFFIDQKTERCPFCGNFSSYLLDYSVDNNIMKVFINGLKLRTSSGLNDYHCHLGKKICKGSTLNPNSIEYISKSFKISNEQALNFIHQRNKSPFYKINHKSDKHYKAFQTHDLTYFIKKYGLDKGTEKFNDMCKRSSIKNSSKYILENYGVDTLIELNKKKTVGVLSWWISKYGEEEGVIKFNEWKNCVKNTKENFIKRHGQDGELKWNQYIEKRKKYYSLESFINKYGKVKGTYLWNNFLRKSSFTKEDYIKKYGEEQYIESRTRGNIFYSNESIKVFDILLVQLRNINIIPSNIKWKDDEYFIYDPINRKIYFYDLYFIINNKSYIIEYDTPFMHPNENYMTENELLNWKNPFNSNQTFEDKILYDKRKIDIAKNKGIDVVTFYVKKEDDIEKNINNFIEYVNKK